KPPEGTNGMLPACSPFPWLRKDSRQPDSSPVCRLGRNTAGPPLPTHDPSWENPCHPPPTPPPDRGAASLASQNPEPDRRRLRHSTGRRPPHDEATGASVGRRRQPDGRPWARTLFRSPGNNRPVQ